MHSQHTRRRPQSDKEELGIEDPATPYEPEVQNIPVSVKRSFNNERHQPSNPVSKLWWTFKNLFRPIPKLGVTNASNHELHLFKQALFFLAMMVVVLLGEFVVMNLASLPTDQEKSTFKYFVRWPEIWMSEIFNEKESFIKIPKTGHSDYNMPLVVQYHTFYENYKDFRESVRSYMLELIEPRFFDRLPLAQKKTAVSIVLEYSVMDEIMDMILYVQEGGSQPTNITDPLVLQELQNLEKSLQKEIRTGPRIPDPNEDINRPLLDLPLRLPGTFNPVLLEPVRHRGIHEEYVLIEQKYAEALSPHSALSVKNRWKFIKQLKDTHQVTKFLAVLDEERMKLNPSGIGSFFSKDILDLVEPVVLTHGQTFYHRSPDQIPTPLFKAMSDSDYPTGLQLRMILPHPADTLRLIQHVLLLTGRISQRLEDLLVQLQQQQPLVTNQIFQSAINNSPFTQSVYARAKDGSAGSNSNNAQANREKEYQQFALSTMLLLRRIQKLDRMHRSYEEAWMQVQWDTAEMRKIFDVGQWLLTELGQAWPLWGWFFSGDAIFDFIHLVIPQAFLGFWITWRSDRQRLQRRFDHSHKERQRRLQQQQSSSSSQLQQEGSNMAEFIMEKEPDCCGEGESEGKYGWKRKTMLPMLSLMVQWFLTFSFLRVLRIISYTGTILPNGNLHCKYRKFHYAPTQSSPFLEKLGVLQALHTTGGCSDLVYSGHVATYTFCCIFFFRYCPSMLVNVLLLLVALDPTLDAVLKNHHYTVDVVVAIYVGVLMDAVIYYVLMPKIVGREVLDELDYIYKVSKNGGKPLNKDSASSSSSSSSSSCIGSVLSVACFPITQCFALIQAFFVVCNRTLMGGGNKSKRTSSSSSSPSVPLSPSLKKSSEHNI